MSKTNRSLAGPWTPPRMKKRSIVIVLFPVSILAMAWYGPYLHGMMFQYHRIAIPYPRSDAERRPPRGQEFWERTEESNCFHLDSVCNWKDGWFYGPVNRGEASAVANQPTAMLLGTLLEDINILAWNDLNDFDVDERIQFNISRNSHDVYDGSACSFSSTPNHLIAQSAYNEMMGEFYVRTVLGLNRWMRDYPQISDDDTRVYVHLVERYDVFEGHRLFLGGMPNDGRFESFRSLMPRNDTCRCFRKLVFCGYRMENVTAFSDDSQSNIFLRDNIYNTPSFKDRIRSRVDLDDPNGIVFKPEPAIPNPKTNCAECLDTAYRELRSDLMKMHSMRYPNLDEKIRRYRRQILAELELIGNSTTDADGWKLVGLARRKSRRLWLNVDDVMSTCKEIFARHRVACIIVDVEEAESPEEQLIMHRSLHAFIGVHGAQLTQGVLLPTHGYVLELLPWIPSYTGGEWVASTRAPTPLGIIFHNTDINHYGYSLGRESTPLCSHVDTSDENGTRLCLTNEENEGKFNWNVRDFIVPVNVVTNFLSIVLQQGENATCAEMKSGAERGNFVLYNAFCHQSANQTNFVTEHYYRIRRRH